LVSEEENDASIETGEWESWRLLTYPENRVPQRSACEDRRVVLSPLGGALGVDAALDLLPSSGTEDGDLGIADSKRIRGERRALEELFDTCWREAGYAWSCSIETLIGEAESDAGTSETYASLDRLEAFAQAAREQARRISEDGMLRDGWLSRRVRTRLGPAEEAAALIRARLRHIDGDPYG
jgi:hypothetical protein